MDREQRPAATSMVWNAGGWFGSQAGCTLWLLILGVLLLSRDPLAAGACLGSFALANLWGWFLWRSRRHLSAYAGIQRFLLAISVLYALVVLTARGRGAVDEQISGQAVSTALPYWLILVPPALMLVFFLREREARKRG